jgi:hypothetical protein
MGPRYVLSVAAVAVGFAVFFGIGGFFLAPGNAAIPTALAFAATGMLGGTVSRTLKHQEERISNLERRLSDESHRSA